MIDVIGQTHLHLTLSNFASPVLAVADLLYIPKGCRRMSGGKSRDLVNNKLQLIMLVLVHNACCLED